MHESRPTLEHTTAEITQTRSLSLDAAMENPSSASLPVTGHILQQQTSLNQAQMTLSNAAIEGLLTKYTNVVKGYQFRWFTLSPGRGTLEYYMPDDKKKIHPRGCVYLAGCTISPSDEDSQTFTVSAASGDSYKLKATDAKERQYWVNKLRQVALTHETNIARQHAPVSPETAAAMAAVREMLSQTQRVQRKLVHAIEGFTSTEPDLLLLKATTQSGVMSLEQCFAILQSLQHHQQYHL